MFLRQQKLDLTYNEDEFGDEPRIKTMYLENIKLPGVRYDTSKPFPKEDTVAR